MNDALRRCSPVVTNYRSPALFLSNFRTEGTTDSRLLLSQKGVQSSASTTRVVYLQTFSREPTIEGVCKLDYYVRHAGERTLDLLWRNVAIGSGADNDLVSSIIVDRYEGHAGRSRL